MACFTINFDGRYWVFRCACGINYRFTSAEEAANFGKRSVRSDRVVRVGCSVRVPRVHGERGTRTKSRPTCPRPRVGTVAPTLCRSPRQVPNRALSHRLALYLPPARG